MHTLTRTIPLVLVAPALHAQTLRIDIAGNFWAPNAPFHSDIFPTINNGGRWSVSMILDIVPTPNDNTTGDVSHTGVVSSYALSFNDDTFAVSELEPPYSQISFVTNSSRDVFTIGLVYQSADLNMLTSLRLLTAPGGSQGQIYFEDLARPDFDASRFYCQLHFLHLPGGSFNGESSNVSITVIPAPAPFAILGACGLLAARRRR